ncbi:MAG: hypothetical protein ACM31E_02435, partial [Fibrobacterota bacterium]
MIDPCYYLDLKKNGTSGRFPRLQKWLSLVEPGYSSHSHITMPEDLFTVICTSRVCFISSYQHGIQKLLDLAYGNEFVSASFDESISITFYHKTKGSITYSIAPDFFEKISKMEFYLQKNAGIPINDIPIIYANDVLKTVFNYDDSSIFLLHSFFYF